MDPLQFVISEVETALKYVEEDHERYSREMDAHKAKLAKILQDANDSSWVADYWIGALVTLAQEARDTKGDLTRTNREIRRLDFLLRSLKSKAK